MILPMYSVKVWRAKEMFSLASQIVFYMGIYPHTKAVLLARLGQFAKLRASQIITNFTSQAHMILLVLTISSMCSVKQYCVRSCDPLVTSLLNTMPYLNTQSDIVQNTIINFLSLPFSD